MRTHVLAAVALAVATMPARAQQRSALRDLLGEGNKNNAEILAAQKEWEAATYVRPQVSVFPLPQFSLQSFSVGSPRPGAGLSNSNFAYVGIGASQELPYPGKLRLKGAAADRAADEELAQINVVRSKVAEQIKTDYLRLAYLQETLGLLNASRSTLTQVIDVQLARYRTGEGGQAEILKAQLERTKFLREIVMHHEEMAQVQADLKSALNRNQDSPDLIVDALVISPFNRSVPDVVRTMQHGNPVLVVDASSIAKQQSRIESARLAGKPDFSVGYMYERTGLDFPAYYMATFNIMLPRKKLVAAERAEASARVAQAALTRDAHLQAQLAESRKQYAAVMSTEEELNDFRDGILPQADAVYQSDLAALQSNKQTLDAVLTALNEVLQLKRDYAQAVLDHEMALVRLEALTGESLR
jgi:outer membrane protein, heavy metal efflux system